jgi:2-polyprenyl-3-methyl-5-hydroxy-6-metoxy-1,4-benzoquinol methylase
METRSRREIQHGRWLADGKAEKIWGWDTPAGRLRAVRRVNLLVAGAGLAPGMSVLEIGCGTGIFTRHLIGLGVDLTAIDISPELILQAQKGIDDRNAVRFQVGRFENFDSSEMFDAIIGSSVLHHLDLTSALPQMRKLLKPGGRFCFTEPNMLNPQIALQKNIPWLKHALGDSPDETAFLRWSLKHQLESVGFHSIRIMPFDWLHPATPLRFLGAVSDLGDRLERIPGLKELAGSLWICGQQSRG